MKRFLMVGSLILALMIGGCGSTTTSQQQQKFIQQTSTLNTELKAWDECTQLQQQAGWDDFTVYQHCMKSHGLNP